MVTIEDLQNMEKLFNKVAKKVTLGLEKVLTVTGTVDTTEDPIYIEKKKELQELETQFANLENNLTNIAVSTNELSNAIVETSSYAVEASLEDQNNFQNASKNRTAISDCYSKLNMYISSDFDEKIMKPISSYLEEIAELNKISQKRDKNRLYMQNLQRKVEKNSENGKEDQQCDDKYQFRKEKYTALNERFIRGVNDLLERKQALVASVFVAFRNTSQQMINESHARVSNMQ